MTRQSKAEITNEYIAKQMRLMAKLLEIKGENSFRVRAYNRAADEIEEMPQNIAVIAGEAGAAELQKIPGIGKTIAEKIVDLVETGSIGQLKKLREEVPESLLDLTAAAGLGPKRAWALYQNLGVKNLRDLKKAAEDGEVQKLEGFGVKLEQQILADIERATEEQERYLWPEAAIIASPLLEYVREIAGVEKVEAAGSLRRRRETVGDLDILASGKDGSKIIGEYLNYPGIRKVVAQGDTKCSIILDSGMQVDLRVVEPSSFGAALLYFTGSKAHGIALRHRAISQGKKVNEYGLYQDEKYLAGESEEEMYGGLGLNYIEPELREDRGEIEAAADNRLPDLIELKDIRGDFQCHTDASDGVHTLEEMAEAAAAMGYEYLAVTDHSKHIGIVGGMSGAEVLDRFKEIERLNDRYRKKNINFTVLKSAEVDILKDGALDYSDEILKEMDFVVAAVHSSFGLSREEQTERIITAMKNPYVHALAHPTGRIIGKRSGYEVDVDALITAAKETNTALELNAHPSRLDLDSVYLKRAKELGVKIIISTDAHSTEGFEVMKYGIGQARRGWLEKSDVLNSYSWNDVKKYF